MKEIWKDVVIYNKNGEPDHRYIGLYQVSNLGRVKSIQRIEKNSIGRKRTIKERIRKYVKRKDGYLLVVLSKDSICKSFFIHRLVGFAFIPNPENKKEINHLNGIKDDNRVENLSWSTASENITHRNKNGLVDFDKIRGDKQWNSILTEDNVYLIKWLLKYTKLTQKEIGFMFGVSHVAISLIKRNINWKHVILEEI